ncbi:CHAT domain-containing protein [Planktothricoides raciborskii]|uniref:CHAT domain-containing protein n=1 Tax=Planktothricoides raciborskii FACHB-1370 TaxID=2949576 RepID=A0ABR8EJ66_9CYAN|nr:CHAT domain-containing protein [Planktothricoides raciborskii]MBD2546798.1 CHAT domain-containing protein [Planktothricoides raciborskii FACHB-1370]MBD2583085.1 CHAT domain-containing protein [Planktothricoides raciborskii FACHB-1261]
MKPTSLWILLATISLGLNIGIHQSVARESMHNSIRENFRENFQSFFNASLEGEAQAEALYQQGNFHQTIQILENLANQYAALEDDFNQSRILRNLSLVYLENGELTKAENSVQQSLEIICQNINCAAPKLNANREYIQSFAQALEVKGKLEYYSGNAEDAQETWKKAVNLYDSLGDIQNSIRTKISQVQALRSLGLYRTALENLIAMEQVLAEEPDNLVKAQALQSLGEGLRVVRKLPESTKILEQSLAIAKKKSNQDMIAGVLISLGNNAEFNHDDDAALKFYQEATQTSDNPRVIIESQLNEMRVLIRQTKPNESLFNLTNNIKNTLENLPKSQQKNYAQINFALQLIDLKNNQNITDKEQITKLSEIAELLAVSVQESRQLGDQRGEAYALGYLGHLYEQNEQWEEARTATREALLIAQAINADDIAYQWQWQTGRILRAQGEREKAIISYQASVKTLQSLRGDLVAMSSDAQFSFQETVEPVYREMVSLLLAPNQEVTQADLIIAREAIEALQLAELDNFFQDACLDTKPVQIDQVDPTAAVFYPIILPDRLEVIVTIPGQPLHRHSIPVAQEKVEETLLEMRNALTAPWRRRSVRYFLPFSQQLYDWLIRPFEADLAANQIKTLVFVLDGALRSSPISALYDGEKYLTEKYNIGLTPGLQLLPPQPIAQEELQALTAGLTEARQGFPALPGVAIEFDRIEQKINTNKLLNESFTEPNFRTIFQEVEFPIVHLGTHGEFSSNAEDTFVLTWDDRINANELDNLLRLEERQGATIELLILSACQTAVGDKRAALGLAGVAVRAGARSTLASLWYVSDEATAELMSQFYQELVTTNLTLGRRQTKAEALSAAQRAMIQNPEFSHPYYWAAFVLVGNWL